jgi:tRNA(Ile)-lysidine synthase TilS/MesJ
MANLPGNTSSRYRMARLALFRNVAAEQNLAGVLLAHHADDHAETVLQRLLRGSGPPGIGGMQRRAQLGDLTLLRPLLAISGSALRRYLQSIGQPWREDASNASDVYLRNRLRPLLRQRPELADDLRNLGIACQALRDWTRTAAPDLPPAFATEMLAELPLIVATESARRWLIGQGVPPDQISPAVVDRLVTMARDAASAPRELFPGQVQVRRKKRTIQVAGE